jgi:membrane protease YdiL (CAAX protease family)
VTDLARPAAAYAATALAVAGMACYVGGRTIGGGALLDVAVVGTYLDFAGLAGIAALLLTLRAARPVAAQTTALSLFLFAAVLVAYPFNRAASAVVLALLVLIVGGGWLVRRDLARLWPRERPGPEPNRMSIGVVAITWSTVWIPIAAVVAVYPGPDEFSLGSSALTVWLAVAAIIAAVAGRRYRIAAVVAAVAVVLDAAFVGVRSIPRIATGNVELSAYVIAGAIACALSIVQLSLVARRRAIVDPVQLIALQIATGLLLRWAYYLGSGLGLDPATYRPDTALTPFQTELPLLAIALAAVGFGISRSVVPAIRRVGLAVPRLSHVVIALLVADGYLFVAGGATLLTYRLMPDAYFQIYEILFKVEGSLPGWAAIAFGLLAGICEETLFRGVLQPRIGIVAAAVLFASIHIQYGLTPVLGVVFVAGIAYGLLRKYASLTAAIIAHAATDTGGFPFGQWPVTLLWIAVLVAVVAHDVVRRRTSERSPVAVARERGADLGDNRVRMTEEVGRGET